MTPKTQLIFKTVNILFWIVFIGLCIKTGAILTAFIISIAVNGNASHDLYRGLDLSGVRAYQFIHYIFVVSSIILQTAIKAYIAYLIVRVFSKLKFSSPFEPDASGHLFKTSYISFILGILAVLSNHYAEWMLTKGVQINYQWGGHEILFFSGIIYVIAELFKKGSELQQENNLTI